MPNASPDRPASTRPRHGVGRPAAVTAARAPTTTVAPTTSHVVPGVAGCAASGADGEREDDEADAQRRPARASRTTAAGRRGTRPRGRPTRRALDARPACTAKRGSVRSATNDSPAPSATSTRASEVDGVAGESADERGAEAHVGRQVPRRGRLQHHGGARAHGGQQRRTAARAPPVGPPSSRDACQWRPARRRHPMLHADDRGTSHAGERECTARTMRCPAARPSRPWSTPDGVAGASSPARSSRSAVAAVGAARR